MERLVKVTLLTQLAGPAGCHTPGTVLDLPVDQAWNFVRRGFGAWVGQPPEEQAAPIIEQPAAKLFKPPTEPPLAVGQHRKPKTA